MKTTIPFKLLSNKFLKMGQTKPLFAYFRSFHMTNKAQFWLNFQSVDGILGTRTLGAKMVGTDESTELWRETKYVFVPDGVQCDQTARYFFNVWPFVTIENWPNCI